jgi:hypothetical protein
MASSVLASGGSGGSSPAEHAPPPMATSGMAAGGSGMGGGGGEAGVGDESVDAGFMSDAATIDDAMTGPDAGGTIDDFNGMCEGARWSHVSDACWSCWCAQCGDSLNIATRRSMEIFECMFEKDQLVNDFFELTCEIRAGLADCVDGAMDDWDKLVAFDTCLMQTATFPAFRACEAECGVTYSGDVCTRYP